MIREQPALAICDNIFCRETKAAIWSRDRWVIPSGWISLSIYQGETHMQEERVQHWDVCSKKCSIQVFDDYVSLNTKY